jgi:hypothetical protein
MTDKQKDDNGSKDDVESAGPTIVSMPVWMIEELQKKVKEVKQAQSKPEPASGGSRTMAFDPTEAAKFRAALAQAGARAPGAAAGGAAASAAAADASVSAQPQEERTDEGGGGRGTLMFSPGDAARIKDEMLKARGAAGARASAPKPPVAPEPEGDGLAATAAYSREDVQRLRDKLLQEDAEGGAHTVAYMPAQGQAAPIGMEPEPPVAEEEGEAYAPTQVFMKAATDVDVRTVAYTPEERQRVLEQAARRGAKVDPEASEVDAGGATAVYSAEQSKQFREAYDMLRGSGSGAAATTPEAMRKAADKSVSEAPTVPPTPTQKAPPERKPAPVTPARGAAPAATVPSEPEAGKGSASNAFVLVALFLLAAAAAAVILHLLGVIDLPFNLPKLQ